MFAQFASVTILISENPPKHLRLEYLVSWHSCHVSCMKYILYKLRTIISV